MKQRKRVVRKHVSEIQAFPRVSSMAERIGLVLGFALDLSVTDSEDNMPWDFNVARKIVKQEKWLELKHHCCL